MTVEGASFPEKIAFSREKMWRRLHRYGGYVAGTNKVVLGYAICSKIRTRGRIVSIAVHPSFRGLGLGVRLMRRAMADLKRAGALRFGLQVQTSATPAIRMYESLGFRVVRVLRAFYGDGSDAFSMRRIL